MCISESQYRDMLGQEHERRLFEEEQEIEDKENENIHSRTNFKSELIFPKWV